ncbi:MAG: NUDIX hydrolase [Actinomycetota bacterium]
MARFGPEALERLRRTLPDDDGSSPASELRLAAVLVPLFVREESVHVVLTKRTDNVRTHQGQVSFPGGAWEPGDRSLRDTALREAHEEVGLRPQDAEILGVLEDTPTAVSGFLVRPFVCAVPHPYEFVHDVAEVAGLLAPRLDVFADHSRRRETIRERDGVRYPIFYYDVDGEMVWGATARMLVALTDHLLRA